MIPWHPMKYIATSRPTSSQLTPHPHANGTAATNATNGTTMNASSANCSIDRLLSPPSVADGNGAATASDGSAPSITGGVLGTGTPLRVRRTLGRPWLRFRNLRLGKYGSDRYHNTRGRSHPSPAIAHPHPG